MSADLLPVKLVERIKINNLKPSEINLKTMNEEILIQENLLNFSKRNQSLEFVDSSLLSLLLIPALQYRVDFCLQQQESGSPLSSAPFFSRRKQDISVSHPSPYNLFLRSSPGWISVVKSWAFFFHTGSTHGREALPQAQQAENTEPPIAIAHLLQWWFLPRRGQLRGHLAACRLSISVIFFMGITQTEA